MELMTLDMPQVVGSSNKSTPLLELLGREVLPQANKVVNFRDRNIMEPMHNMLNMH
jgi:hypothetical protein